VSEVEPSDWETVEDHARGIRQKKKGTGAEGNDTPKTRAERQMKIFAHGNRKGRNLSKRKRLAGEDEELHKEDEGRTPSDWENREEDPGR
jgi:hypothetical protein